MTKRHEKPLPLTKRALSSVETAFKKALSPYHDFINFVVCLRFVTAEDVKHSLKLSRGPVLVSLDKMSGECLVDHDPAFVHEDALQCQDSTDYHLRIPVPDEPIQLVHNLTFYTARRQVVKAWSQGYAAGQIAFVKDTDCHIPSTNMGSSS